MSKLKEQLLENMEYSKTLRFRSKEQMIKYRWLRDYCEERELKINNYLVNLICEHIDSLMIKTALPDFTNSIYAVVRKAVFSSTVGLTSNTATMIKPLIQQAEITDMKLNLILHFIFNQLDLRDVKNFQHPDDQFLEEPEKFTILRAIIDQNLSQNLKAYLNDHKNESLNAKQFAQLMSYDTNPLKSKKKSPEKKDKENVQSQQEKK